jgi:hypothetical protein
MAPRAPDDADASTHTHTHTGRVDHAYCPTCLEQKTVEGMLACPKCKQAALCLDCQGMAESTMFLAARKCACCKAVVKFVDAATVVTA